ncbi:hypothetical protein AGATL06_18930 [Agathobaculum sp. TL06]
MKKRKYLAYIGTLALAVVTLCTVAFASEVPQIGDEVKAASDGGSYLYFVDGIQVTESEYTGHTSRNDTATIDETTEATDSSEFMYFIASQDGIRQVSEDEYNSTVGTQPTIGSRTTGSWSIRSSRLEAGQTKHYYQGNGDDFDVAEDEYILLTIDVEDHERHFDVGFVGTTDFSAPITITKDHGGKIAFIDTLEVPGTYRVSIKNNGDKTEYISGEIEVLKR